MDDGAGGGGYGDDCSCGAEMLEEMVDHEMGSFDVGFLHRDQNESMGNRRYTYEVLPPEGRFDVSDQAGIQSPGRIDQDVHLVKVLANVLI